MMNWSDLVARLAAARDLRAELGMGEEMQLASFDPHSAAHLALHHEKEPSDSKHGVNPDDLVNGKGPGGIVVSPNENDKPANRGNT